MAIGAGAAGGAIVVTEGSDEDGPPSTKGVESLEVPGITHQATAAISMTATADPTTMAQAGMWRAGSAGRRGCAARGSKPPAGVVSSN